MGENIATASSGALGFPATTMTEKLEVQWEFPLSGGQTLTAAAV
jgi:hypothetical protein